MSEVKESGDLKETNSPQNASDLDEVKPGYLGPTPAVNQLPPRGERFWIDRPGLLLSAVNVLNHASFIAIDAEFTQARSHTQASSNRSIPRLALLQLAIDGQCFVVDALRLNDLTLLNMILNNPQITVLLHGAGGDIRVMAERGLNVVRYYDLEATSRSIFGQHESSLAAMLQRAFTMHLDKSLQRTDWTRRPLPPAMIAYAARDAETTLALYYWLDQHYHAILQSHKNTGLPDPVAPWIEPFLSATATMSAEIAVTDARAQGIIKQNSQISTDCLNALQTVAHPIRRNRLLRLIADLSLVRLAPNLLPLLQGGTADERAGSARTLGRLGIQSAQEQIRPLLQDPVYDVRKAASNALHALQEKDTSSLQPPSSTRPTSRKGADGTRSWIIESSEETGQSNDQDWKARLRKMMEG